MDITKFADMVTRRRLYMARADLLGDEHEGTTPAAELEYWRLLAEETEEQRRITQGNRDQLSEFAREFRSSAAFVRTLAWQERIAGDRRGPKPEGYGAIL
jgi:hypothetical protein